MKVMRIYLLMTLVLLSSFAFAQEQPDTLSLAQAKEYALQHNKTLLNTRDNAASSKVQLWETISQGLPQVDAGLDYLTYFNRELELNFGGAPMSIEMGDQLTGDIQVSQLIFSGQYIAGIQTAKIARTLTNQSIISSELDVKENVTTTYYLILTNEHTLRIIGENLKNLDAILQHTNNLYKAGVAEQTDVDQLKITVSQLKNTQKSLERMNQLSYNMLKFQLGVAPDAKIVLADSINQMIQNINQETALINDFDISNNINYQLTESQVLLTKKQVDMQKWAFTPTVAGFYSYTEKFVTTALDFTPNSLAGISVSMPIFSSGMRISKVSKAKINLDIAQRNQEMVKDQLETQKNQLMFNYQNALENYNTQKENVDIAGRVYQNIQNKYQQGLSSSLDLTQANTNYLNAENNYLNSILTLLQAQTSLDKLYNRL